ncbi:NUDIX domain-containing protein [Acinetobacter sp. B5B]|uniref:NUDIX hydrolase n=1 Tax=Acinetobacter baretiae TaxID=2605383 RepID=UPI0018C25BCE|nr:NUDIX domain-containing protein [Acinetobacter baretiae]MBF7683759.1 NUDIX domain-containing protein [Acinetobacter baretiae]MBF7686334.1 NUDIX domain-containing protein [Acinetobacter baretiae]
MTIDLNQKIIYVAAAIITDPYHRMLVVRKKNTHFFMQVGGKIEPSESSKIALQREIKEEIQVSSHIRQDLGIIKTSAANEPGFALKAHLFEVDIFGTPYPSAEIAEMLWLDLTQTISVPLAPLTRDFVIPMLQQKIK